MAARRVVVSTEAPLTTLNDRFRKIQEAKERKATVAPPTPTTTPPLSTSTTYNNNNNNNAPTRQPPDQLRRRPLPPRTSPGTIRSISMTRPLARGVVKPRGGHAPFGYARVPPGVGRRTLPLRSPLNPPPPRYRSGIPTPPPVLIRGPARGSRPSNLDPRQRARMSNGVVPSRSRGGGRSGRGATSSSSTRGRTSGRGRGGRGRGTNKALTKVDLDNELDSYMFKDEQKGSALLDQELEEYMSQRGTNGQSHNNTSTTTSTTATTSTSTTATTATSTVATTSTATITTSTTTAITTHA